MKKADFIKATANGMPVFNTYRGVKCIAVNETDTVVNNYIRSTAKKTGAIIVQAIRFTTDEQGKITAECAGSPFTQQINQINLFAADYSEAHAQIAAMASRASNARRARMQAEAEANTVREHNLAVCTELLPSITDTLLRFVDCRVSKDYHNGNVTITIPAAELENLVALLAHAEPQA